MVPPWVVRLDVPLHIMVSLGVELVGVSKANTERS